MNAPKLYSNLPALLYKHRIGIREFSRRIDYRYETVRQFYHGELTRLPLDLIERICAEFNCGVDEVLTHEKPEGFDYSS